MTESIKGFRISANRTPYRRAGLDLSEPLLIAQDALDADDLETLCADSVVHIAEIEIPSDEVRAAHPPVAVVATTGAARAVATRVAPDAPIVPATNEAETIDQIAQVEDLESLDTLTEDETRPNVLAAIESRRAAIAEQPIKLPTLKGDIQALLTRRGIAYEDSDTIADLTKRARESLNIAE